MRHSNSTAAKALFIKKLSVVWAVLPQFTHQNTVIIDDISEKFDYNPPENCIVVSLLAPTLRPQHTTVVLHHGRAMVLHARAPLHDCSNLIMLASCL